MVAPRPKFFGESTLSVLIQASFRNPNVVPSGLPRRDDETPNGRKDRKETHAPGIQILAPTPEISVETLREEMETTGFYLVDGSYQMRINPREPGEYYPAVRFIFSRDRRRVDSMDDDWRETLYSDFDQLTKGSFWRVRAYLNPGKVRDTHHASINLEVRKPRHDNAGNPITEILIGSSEPTPIIPAGTLRVVDLDLVIS